MDSQDLPLVEMLTVMSPVSARCHLQTTGTYGGLRLSASEPIPVIEATVLPFSKPGSLGGWVCSPRMLYLMRLWTSQVRGPGVSST